MVSFIVYDLIFLVLFTLAVVLFLYNKRHNLKRQGLLYLYRTKLGIKFIEWTARKFPRTLNALQYVVITSGYLLMTSMIYFLAKFSYFYITSPTAARSIKVPVILPLIPYLPEIFNLDFLPPFYFTYWIIILAIVAIPHEFAHGIFARLNKIRIHATGFGFLGPFLAAFVEPDEKQMEGAKKFPQLSILAAGTFANVIFTIIFALMFWLFFATTFTPAGAVFNTYAADLVPISGINSVNGNQIINLAQIPALLNSSSEFAEIKIQNTTFFANPVQLSYAIENNIQEIPAVFDSPAFRARLSGAITEINSVQINNFNDLSSELKSHAPGDKVTIKTIQENQEIKEYEIELAGNPTEPNKAFLGIGIIPQQSRGLIGSVYNFITKIKDPFTYYESSLGNLGIFIYHLLWWCVLISISVALVNMLPLGIFDGGRFFYLTIWGITGSKSLGQKAFKASTWILLLLIVALMVKWVFAFM